MLSVAKWGLGHTALTQTSVLFQYESQIFEHPVQPFRCPFGDQKQPFPSCSQSTCAVPSWPQPASKDFSSTVLQPHWPSFNLSKSHLFQPRSLPQGLCTSVLFFFFWTPKPSSPHLGKSDIFLTDEVSTWKILHSEKVKIIPGLRKYNPDCNKPRWGQQQDQQKSVFLTGPRCICKKQLVPHTSKWLCLLTNCLSSPTCSCHLLNKNGSFTTY